MFQDIYRFCHFTGSSSSPDEDRLLRHLFHRDYQPHNLMTTPIAHINETVDVTVGIAIRKIIALVGTIPYVYLRNKKFL